MLLWTRDDDGMIEPTDPLAKESEDDEAKERRMTSVATAKRSVERSENPAHFSGGVVAWSDRPRARG